MSAISMLVSYGRSTLPRETASSRRWTPRAPVLFDVASVSASEMSRAERPTFGASDVIEIASKFEADDGAFVIGGQATNLWAWFFRDKDRSLLLQEPLTSEDIDYFGTYEIAKNIAAALGGEVLRPAPDDHSPSTAQIVATFHGKRLKIDFLGSVLGVKERELRRGVSVLEVGGEIDGVSTVVLIKVLHPVLCLKTRIINMLNPLTRRTDRIARRQAEAAFVIVRCFIEDALNAADGWRDAKDCFRNALLVCPL